MYANDSNNAPFCTHISLYVVWRVDPPSPTLRRIYGSVCSKDKHYNEIGLRTHNTNTVLDSIVNTFGRGLCTHLKRERIFTLTSCSFHISNLIQKLELNTLHDLEVVTGWVSSTSDLMVKIVCGVGSAHNGTTYLIYQYEYTICLMLLLLISLLNIHHSHSSHNHYS